jgi:hypothetical protein
LNFFPTAIAFNEEEKYLGIGTKEGLILFLTRIDNSPNSGYNLDIFHSHFDHVKSILFNRSSTKLFSSSFSEIVVWDIN